MKELLIKIYTMVGLNKYFKRKRRAHPNDSKQYIITQEVIDFTVKVLAEYGAKKYPEEGLIYWAGKIHGSTFEIISAVAPKTTSTRYGFETSNASNARFVEFICDNDLQYIAQVHSHPGKWVDHSIVDDEQTAFRSEGLVSIVVPVFGSTGMIPLSICGFHRYTNGQFVRLANSYIKEHFEITSNNNFSSLIKDFRHE
jgi:hypothetical protein